LLTIGWTFHAMMNTPFTNFKIEIVQTSQMGGRDLRGLGDILGVCRRDGAQCRCECTGCERDAETSQKSDPFLWIQTNVIPLPCAENSWKCSPNSPPGSKPVLKIRVGSMFSPWALGLTFANTATQTNFATEGMCAGDYLARKCLPRSARRK
jgi:hypothetical protein